MINWWENKFPALNDQNIEDAELFPSEVHSDQDSSYETVENLLVSSLQTSTSAPKMLEVLLDQNFDATGMACFVKWRDHEIDVTQYIKSEHSDHGSVLTLDVLNISDALLRKLKQLPANDFLQLEQVFPAGLKLSLFDHENGRRFYFVKSPTLRIGEIVNFGRENLPVAPFFNRQGALCIRAFAPEQPKTQIFTDRFTVNGGMLELEGHLIVIGAIPTNAQVNIQARTTAYGAKPDTKFELNQFSLKKFHDHLRYDFKIKHDFACEFEQIPNDAVDFYLDITFAAAPKPIRKRIGSSRYLVRRKTKVSHIVVGQKTLNIVPYYTFGAKNPSIQFEHFDTDAFKMMNRAIRNKRINSKKERPIWLLGEVSYKAQDNAMWLFRYLQENHREIDSYYIMDRNAPEFRNVEDLGNNVVQFRSAKHIQLLLSADRVIGTHQPLQMYPTRDPQLRKLIKAKHVFLQHGVTAAKWIVPVNGKHSTDFSADLIIVNSEREKQFFVEDCGYKPEEVAVTGFARFDRLFQNDVESNPQTLLIMPTWRPWLQDPETFEDSEYFKRWTELLKDEDLLGLIESKTLELVFCLHPNMQQYSDKFSGIGARVVYQGEVDVQDLLKQSGVMVTDYSSVGFDFSFLDKPVVFYQFDAREFPTPHADPFSELPGPVIQDLPNLISALKSIYSETPKISAEYSARASRFLKIKDRSNRARIVQAIQELPNKNSAFEKLYSNEFTRTLRKHLEPSQRNRKLYIALYRCLRRIVPLDPNTIVFETNLARSFGDSPKAIFDELIKRQDTRTLVVCVNRRFRAPGGNVKVVRRHSLPYIWYLAKAKFWINNHNFPDYVVRRRKGIYIQTWHGTPLKKMFKDQENFFGRDPGYISRVEKMSAQWNRLVSPSDYFTNALQTSYEYSGPVYELGHARNDVLKSGDSHHIRQAERASLGLAEDAFAVLYAPTFRDDNPTTKGRFGFEWNFEITDFVNKLDENIVLLVRKHNLVNSDLNIPVSLAGRVIDVSSHQDMNTLSLASDMLITDYSSSFFDYSLLNRPIAFYAYDLEKYRDSLRGFYLDYERDLPGPIVTDSETLFEVIDYCYRNQSVVEKWIPDGFTEVFSPHDDGNSASRIIRTLLN